MPVGIIVPLSRAQERCAESARRSLRRVVSL